MRGGDHGIAADGASAFFLTNTAKKIECSVTDNAKTPQSDNILYPLTIRLMDEAAPNVGKTRLSISEAANHA
jgi:hypothetical protein